ncbi:MAG: hypothetical protein AAF253_01255 [Pseudomonadota bacterium]
MTPAARETIPAIIHSPITDQTGLAPNAVTAPVPSYAPITARSASLSPLEARRRRQLRWINRS